jgi:transcriptional regulator with XRE-family HTH domain
MNDEGRARSMRVLASRLRALPHGAQKRLAELAGLSEETLSRWRTMKGNPRLTELEALADAMAVSVGYLLLEDSKESPVLPSVEPSAAAADARVDLLLRRAERAAQELKDAVRLAEDRKRKKR